MPSRDQEAYFLYISVSPSPLPTFASFRRFYCHHSAIVDTSCLKKFDDISKLDMTLKQLSEDLGSHKVFLLWPLCLHIFLWLYCLIVQIWRYPVVVGSACLKDSISGIMMYYLPRIIKCHKSITLSIFILILCC